MPGVVLFSARLLFELLLTPVRALRRLLSGDESDWDEPALAPAPAVAPPDARPGPRRRAPRRRPARARSEPTRGRVAATREAAREAETGSADSAGDDV